MRSRCAGVVGLLLLVACGLTNTADPNAVHVANVSYSDTACTSTSCNGVLRFRLLNTANEGRAGLVQVGSHGVQPYMSVWTNADGWQQMAWTVEQTTRPYTITVCPQGLAAGDSRCSSASTG
jgi:hypothetical protein